MAEINEDIHKQEQRHAVCQPEKTQKKQRQMEMSIELNSSQMKAAAYSKCLMDNADIWCTEV